MDPSQSSRVAGRARGLRRVGQLTRWSAAGGGLAAVVLGVLLARDPAVASTTVGSPSSPSDAPQASVQDTPAPGWQPTGEQGLQPPVPAPQPSHRGGSHILSGGS
ncbi:MAG: hypothetical protein JO063_12205 [Pseudonocardiales bacterium]|nr:hypothetical protein [Pseudonocardiales bacterium]MBV9031339.1 hypothetical protein [Pseudonocardiales bacterium]MBW0010855.1 hypothetical protein [Pseudonocardiales bacterium]